MSRNEEKTGVESSRNEYEKPQVSSEEVFETLALVCTKAIGQCTTAPGEPVAQS